MDKIIVSDCGIILRKATKLANDKRIGAIHALSANTFLTEYQKSCKNIVIYSIKNDYITQDQINYIGEMWERYQRIIEFNQGYEEGFREKTATLLENIVNFTEPHAKGNLSLQRQKILIRDRGEQILSGKYFWDVHLVGSINVLSSLKKNNINVNEFEPQAKQIYERVKFDYYGN